MQSVKFISGGSHKERIQYSNGEEVIRTYSKDLKNIVNIQVIKPRRGLTNLQVIQSLASKIGY